MMDYCFGIQNLKFSVYFVMWRIKNIKKKKLKTVQIGRDINTIGTQIISTKTGQNDLSFLIFVFLVVLSWTQFLNISSSPSNCSLPVTHFSEKYVFVLWISICDLFPMSENPLIVIKDSDDRIVCCFFYIIHLPLSRNIWNLLLGDWNSTKACDGDF